MATKLSKGLQDHPADNDFIQALEEYECWNPLLKILENRLQDNHKNIAVDAYERVIRIYNRHLENLELSIRYGQEMISKFQLSFVQFHQRILPKIRSNPENEGFLLEGLSDSFHEVVDQIACLEHLCFLLEKKSFHEDRLDKAFQKLIGLAPENIKALKYFKVNYAQQSQWDLVVNTLEKLYRATKRQQEGYRVAQELAATYLYQLDMPQDALRVLDDYCSQSPLDTSTIRFEAFERLNKWHGCIDVLNSYLVSVNSDFDRAVVEFKLAGLFELLDDRYSAQEHYKRCLGLQPNFLEAMERLHYLFIETKKWESLIYWLREFTEQIHDAELVSKLRHAESRLLDGMSHGK